MHLMSSVIRIGTVSGKIGKKCLLFKYKGALINATICVGGMK